MILSSMNIILTKGDEKCPWRCMQELEYYMCLLNNGDKDPRSVGKLEVSASEDYVRKVSKMVGQRGPITYAMFKDIVTKPLVWEKYHQPERRTNAIEECLVVPELGIELFSSEATSTNTIFSYYYIPFSDSFRENHLDELLSYICRDGRYIEQNFEGPGASWFRLLKWLKELSYSPWSSPSCDKNLITVAKWWQNFNPYPYTGFQPCVRTICETALRTNKDGDIPLPPPSNPCICKVCYSDRYRPDKHRLDQLRSFDDFMHSKPSSSTPSLSDIEGYKYNSPHLARDVQPCGTAPTHGAEPLHTSDIDLATLPSPCHCPLCKRSLPINVKIANTPSQTRIESEAAESSFSSRRQIRYPERSSPKIVDKQPQFAVQSAVVNNPATALKGSPENEPAESSSSFRHQTRYYPERSSPKIDGNEPHFAVQSATVNDSAAPLSNGLGFLECILEEVEPRQTQIESKPAESSSPFRSQSRNPELSLPRIEDSVPHWPLANQSVAVIDPATPLKGQLGLPKRRLEEEEPCPQVALHPLWHRNNTDEDAQNASLEPLRKKQKIHHASTLQPRINEHPLPSQMEDILLQHSSPATESCQPRILKRKLEEVEPRPQIAPLPRRYRNNTDEDARPATLGPVRKRQKISLGLESDTSDSDPLIMENNEISTESDTGSEDAMSVDEDFLTANSKLSHLTIGN